MSDILGHISGNVSCAATRYLLTEGRCCYLLIDANSGCLFAIRLPLAGCKLASLPAISVYITLVILQIERKRNQLFSIMIIDI
jgi:hypothetical protein